VLIVSSMGGVPIRLTEERWKHITERHPEMTAQRDQVLATVAEPDMIQNGDFGELLAIRYWPATPLTSKHVVVAYRELTPTDGFVLTAYFASRPSKARAVLWKR
jgi:hypothetical protein